jgi:hypothetical protein
MPWTRMHHKKDPAVTTDGSKKPDPEWNMMYDLRLPGVVVLALEPPDKEGSWTLE